MNNRKDDFWNYTMGEGYLANQCLIYISKCVWQVTNKQLIFLCFMNAYQLFQEYPLPQFFFLPKDVPAG